MSGCVVAAATVVNASLLKPDLFTQLAVTPSSSSKIARQPSNAPIASSLPLLSQPIPSVHSAAQSNNSPFNSSSTSQSTSQSNSQSNSQSVHHIGGVDVTDALSMVLGRSLAIPPSSAPLSQPVTVKTTVKSKGKTSIHAESSNIDTATDNRLKSNGRSSSTGKQAIESPLLTTTAPVIKPSPARPSKGKPTKESGLLGILPSPSPPPVVATSTTASVVSPSLHNSPLPIPSSSNYASGTYANAPAASSLPVPSLALFASQSGGIDRSDGNRSKSTPSRAISSGQGTPITGAGHPPRSTVAGQGSTRANATATKTMNNDTKANSNTNSSNNSNHVINNSMNSSISKGSEGGTSPFDRLANAVSTGSVLNSNTTTIHHPSSIIHHPSSTPNTHASRNDSDGVSESLRAIFNGGTPQITNHGHMSRNNNDFYQNPSAGISYQPTVNAQLSSSNSILHHPSSIIHHSSHSSPYYSHIPPGHPQSYNMHYYPSPALPPPSHPLSHTTVPMMLHKHSNVSPSSTHHPSPITHQPSAIHQPSHLPHHGGMTGMLGEGMASASTVALKSMLQIKHNH